MLRNQGAIYFSWSFKRHLVAMDLRPVSAFNLLNSQLNSIRSLSRESCKFNRKVVNVYEPGQQLPLAKKLMKAKVVDIHQKEPDVRDSFNELMLEASKNVRQRKFIVCEGVRLVEEALMTNQKLHKLFLQKNIKDVPERLKPYVEQLNIPVHRVTQGAIQNWSSLTTPPGVVGVFHKPKVGEIGKLKDLVEGIPVTVICDNLREPGNLGSILRSAAGVGCKRVLLSKGCCDPWDEKVLRGGCGAQFRLPITMNFPIYSLVDCMEIENSGYASRKNNNKSSTSDGGERDGWSNGNWRRPENREDGIGNEDGIDGGKESENGEISSSSKRVECVANSFALFLADSNDGTETDERKTLPIVSYTDVDYTAFENVYLVVGGETEGLSRDILQITSRLETLHPELVRTTVARLRIPLYNQIDSLNASTAFAVIAYEMLRQFQLKRAL